MAPILGVSSTPDFTFSEADGCFRGQVAAWTGMIRVDGTTYTWMGAPTGPALVTQKSFEYTSTKSVFTMDVGGLVEMNITFLSTLTPDDQKRQSLVFSYLDVGVQSLDGNAHDVQLYTDISAGESAGHVIPAITDPSFRMGFRRSLRCRTMGSRYHQGWYILSQSIQADPASL